MRVQGNIRVVGHLRGAAVLGAGLLVLGFAAVQAVADDMPNAMRPKSEQYNCLSMDQNGRTLPNPNVSSICGQADALRLDCELMRTRSDAPMMSNFHCFGWRMDDVRPGVGTQSNPATRGQTTGGR
jgi:hypothetical protein